MRSSVDFDGVQWGFKDFGIHLYIAFIGFHRGFDRVLEGFHGCLGLWDLKPVLFPETKTILRVPCFGGRIFRRCSGLWFQGLQFREFEG